MISTTVKKRLRKLEIAMHRRLVAATAQAMLTLEEGPVLTEPEARRLGPHRLLARIEEERDPRKAREKARESAAFHFHCARFSKWPLMNLYRLYLALNRRQRKLRSRQPRNAYRKDTPGYYLYLCNIYSAMVEEIRRAEQEEQERKWALIQEATRETACETTPEPAYQRPAEPRPLARRSSSFAWAIA